MSYDHVLTHGLGTAGGALWETIRTKCPTHNDVLVEMNNRQHILASYSKGKAYDSIQGELVSDIRFLETIAWRMYMYGVRRTVLTALSPNETGEFFKRRKVDREYRKMVSDCNVSTGCIGCEELENTLRLIKKPCLAPGCPHRGLKKADKWMKRRMRQEWEDTVLKRYMY